MPSLLPHSVYSLLKSPEIEFLDVIWTQSKEFSFLLYSVTSSNWIIMKTLYAQKPQRNNTFMNSAFGVFLGQLVFPLFSTVLSVGHSLWLAIPQLQITDQRLKTLTDRRPSTAACPAQELNTVRLGQKYFILGRLYTVKNVSDMLATARMSVATMRQRWRPARSCSPTSRPSTSSWPPD